MSKRQAGVQLTKDREEEEDWGRDGPADPVVQASAEVLATRKIAMPKSRRKPAGTAAEEAKPTNPFSFATPAAASHDDASSAKTNPFTFLASRTGNGEDKPPASNPFGALSTGTASTTPSFSFGGAAANTSQTPSTATTTNNPPAESTIQAVPATGSTDLPAKENAVSTDSEFDRLLRLRSINACFENAVKSMLANDPFVDLAIVCKEYQAYRESSAKVSIEPAKGTNGTSIYPSFSEPSQASTTEGPKSPEAEKITPSDGAKQTTAAALSFAFNASAPTFTFKASQETPSDSTFKFGESSIKPAEKDVSTTPTFKFGQSSAEEPKAETEKEMQGSPKPSAAVTKPNDFSWTPDRGIKFGDSNKSETKAQAPAFSFNNPLASPAQDTSADKSDSKPASTGFSFGASGSTGFSFGQASSSSATPATETKDASTDNAPAKPAFSFGSANPTFSFGQSSTPTFSFSAPQKAAEPAKESTSEDKTADPENEGDAMPEGPRTNDALIAGPGAGEEDEEEIYTIPKIKLFKFNPKPEAGISPWTDIGICILKILRHKETKKARIIARSEGAGALRLNARIYPHFKYSHEGKVNVKVYLQVDATAYETYLVKTKEKEVALQLLKVLNENKA